MFLQSFYVPKVIAPFPVIVSLERNVKVAAGEVGIVNMELEVETKRHVDMMS